MELILKTDLESQGDIAGVSHEENFSSPILVPRRKLRPGGMEYWDTSSLLPIFTSLPVKMKTGPENMLPFWQNSASLSYSSTLTGSPPARPGNHGGNPHVPFIPSYARHSRIPPPGPPNTALKNPLLTSSPIF